MTGTLFGKGDLVEYLPTGELWNVDSYWPGNDLGHHRPRVTLGRCPEGEWPQGEVMDSDPEQVRLVTRAIERSLAVEVLGGMLIIREAKSGDLISVEPVTPELAKMLGHAGQEGH